MNCGQTLMNYIQRGSSSLSDTFSSRKHTPDFAYARNQYLGNRLRVLCLIFILLSPLWALFDRFLLPDAVRTTVLWGRLIFWLALWFIWGASKLRIFARHQVALCASLLLLPALFYAALLFVTAPYELPNFANYYFIPFLLIATLSIFPLTLVESLLLGGVILLVQLYSCLIDPNQALYYHLQELWLLTALLTVALTANHFHLSLLLRLYRQATHDQLTGLLNRHALLDLWQSNVESDPRRKTQSILLMDLDHFKKVNDEHGHAIGDKVLQAFAALLNNHRQRHDRLARYGGEEFLLIGDQSDLSALQQQAEAIRSAAQAMSVTNLAGEPVSCTVSIGLTLMRPEQSLDQALQQADEALYQAKRQGRNQVVVYRPDAPRPDVVRPGALRPEATAN